MAVEGRDVVVVGGGLAGLSAGVALADAGFRVALLESKPALGGRACSFTDDTTGDLVDNGQHVMMGCYRATLAFLDRLGTSDQLIVQADLAIEMLDGPARRAVLKTSPLPGPLHMTGAILGYRHLTLGERLRAMTGGLRLMRKWKRDPQRLRQKTVSDVMDELGQGDRARRCFWYPLAIATLNESPQFASAGLLAAVLERAFFARRTDSAFLYSKLGLSDLYCPSATDIIEKADGVVACRSIVETIEFEGGQAVAARLRDGARLQAANFVIAVPPERLLQLLPEGAVAEPFFAPLANLHSSPIICVHLWLDREVTDSAFTGFIGTTTQWLFNKRRIFAAHGSAHPGYLSFVISGARDLAERSSDDLLQIVLDDLHAMIPASREACVVKALVLKEKHATIAPDPASDLSRPPVTTPIPNVFLAGDWIQTGLPATIESAVIAGNAAARAIVARTI
ncbi:MAG TPA: hydroxysqualene dehydroxylase HpnE [Candidatus Binataceae bacterium]|nr:hydroxysqualene dehydroxylase HpnE [Candidatus Binataceae bacterium]